MIRRGCYDTGEAPKFYESRERKKITPRRFKKQNQKEHPIVKGHEEGTGSASRIGKDNKTEAEKTK